MKTEVIHLKDIEIINNDRTILQNVNMHVFKGEIIGLIGLVQTGKTSLVQILNGQKKPDSGTIIVNEHKYSFLDAASVKKEKIFALGINNFLVPNLSVAENLYALSHSPLSLPFSPKEIAARAEYTLQQFGLDISPLEKAKNLTRTEQASILLIQIAIQNPSLIIIDGGIEYSLEDIGFFKNLVKRFSAIGISFLIVSNKIADLICECDCIYAIKNGTLTSRITENKSVDYLSGILVSSELKSSYSFENKHPASLPLYKAQDCLLPNSKTPINIDLYPGEICAVLPPQDLQADILGYAIFGITPFKAGSVYVRDKKTNINSTRIAIQCGMALIPNDMSLASFNNFGIQENIILPYIASEHRLFKITDPKLMEVASTELKKGYSLDIPLNQETIKSSNPSASELFKLSIARWEPLKPQIYIFINPFSIVDEQTTDEIKQIFRRLASNGCGILILSNNMYGLEYICSRVEKL